jgi:hypothetical protein
MAGGNMIASFVAGRIRLRDEKLKNRAVVAEIQKRAAQLKGISDVSINQRTGSLLIFYDRVVLRLEQVLHILADYLDAAKTECRKYAFSITNRKIVNLGMLASLAVSMFGAVLDIAVLHITAGIIFLGFLGLHIFRYKNMFFAQEV